jgi:magnesium-transporting ATPase (P-type)
VPETIAKLI